MDRLIRYPEVVRLVGVSRREIERWIAAGIFPKPRKIGRVSLFFLSEIEAFMERLRNQTAQYDPVCLSA